MRTIYLAGGCFWGVQAYFDRVDGVVHTEVGYSNGMTENTSYMEMHRTDHAETVKVEYDEIKLDLIDLLTAFFKIIDPTSINKQGNDIGRQYRSGIYVEDESDLATTQEFLDDMADRYKKHIVVEAKLVSNYVTAEEEHQDYLGKHPGGYCHIDLSKAGV
jgi:peptide methionine sulfoxide reductase msrA/msrB